MHTSNLADENYKKLAELFPNAVTESVDEEGNVVRAIDKDVLMQEISTEVVEGNQERYQLTWPDKRKSVVLANTPVEKTLRLDRRKSVGRDGTKGNIDSENIYIEGDNLDALKLLQETYLGKVKMIYIDPPYNTGSDFIYKDKFSQNRNKYKENSGQYDDAGNILVQNTESNGRFHTDWLNMMYPRLILANDLLKDTGVIFISIDEHELVNLIKICDEVFGVSNFVGIFNWAKTETPENLSKKCKQVIEYIVCYQKKKDDVKFKGIKKTSPSSNGLLNQSNSVGTLVFPANIVKATSIADGIIKKGKYGTDKYDVELLQDTEVKDHLFIKEVILKAKFKWQQSYLDNEIKSGTIIKIPTLNFSPSYEKIKYDAEVPPNLINSKVNVGTNENAGDYQTELFEKKVFSYPKPVSLIEYLLGFDDVDEEYYVLDFFSGSATTAEAVLDLNARTNNSKRKFIMIQLQEDLSNSLTSAKTPAQKEITQNAIDFLTENNCPLNLCELAEERIRRAGKKIQEQTKADIDYGFRVFRIDSSNMKDVYIKPSEYGQTMLENLTDNIKSDRSSEDLLIQTMLDLDIVLSSKIEQITINEKKAYSVADNYLIACFEKDITDEIVTAIAKKHPMYVVFRDFSLKNDSVMANFDQIFKTYSPDTHRKVL